MSHPRSPVKKPPGLPPEPYPCDVCSTLVEWAWVQQHDRTWMWEPASRYWNDADEMIFCGVHCSNDYHKEMRDADAD